MQVWLFSWRFLEYSIYFYLFLLIFYLCFCVNVSVINMNRIYAWVVYVLIWVCVEERQEVKRGWASEREHADPCMYEEPSKEQEVSSYHSLPFALETKSLRIYGVWLASANPETLLFLPLPTLELWAKHTQPQQAFNVGADCEFRT